MAEQTLDAVLGETLAPHLFRRWLEGRPRGATVGLAVCADRCPLHTYLEEAVGISPVVVVGTAIHSPRGRVQTTGTWAGDFVDALDKDRDKDQPVTAGECLAILDRLGL